MRRVLRIFTQLFFFLPLGLVSRGCQDHKGAEDPRQEDIGGAGNKDGWIDGYGCLLQDLHHFFVLDPFQCVHDDDL